MGTKLRNCVLVVSSVFIALVTSFGSGIAAEPSAAPGKPDASAETVRVGSVQPRNRTIDYQLGPAEALARVDENLVELEKLVDKAGEAGCDVVAFPEDTLGLGRWEAANHEALREVLPKAVDRMLERLGRATARHDMYLVCCNDMFDADGEFRNAAFFLGRNGKVIGQYHKVQPTITEDRKPGETFPVFPTPELGGVGMLICYDMVFPESVRCLALQGADIVFVPTLGGAAIGDDDISRAAFRTRAVDNFVYLVVSCREKGSMIISPQGKILAEGNGPDDIAIADIDPFGGREGGDAFNHQQDMRARLFRERNPAAYGVLTDRNPPVLNKIPKSISREVAARIAERALTIGEGEFEAAESLAAAGKSAAAAAAFAKLRAAYPGTWIDRVARERIVKLRLQDKPEPGNPPEHSGIATKYAGDVGIDADPRVVFAENFEQGELDDLGQRWETVTNDGVLSFSEDVPTDHGGQRSLLVTHIGGQGTGGQLYRRLQPGFDTLHARFYVKFDPDCAPIHHFGTHVGGYNPSTPWPQGGAGERPAGDKAFTVGIEPYGKNWEWDYYTYWCEMRGSPPKGQTWGNSFLGEAKPKVERGRWTCVEVMVKINDVGDSNGELALWIDGNQVSHLRKGAPRGKWVFDKFLPGDDGESVRWNDRKGERESFTTPAGGLPFEGFRWRTAKELNLNYLWVYLYITQAPHGHVSRVWFDDIVVATDYIGPIARMTAESR